MIRPKPDRPSPRRAFSLIELVIVVVITGLVAAIAIPRMSNAVGSATDSSVAGSLAVLIKAADIYAAEHSGVPVGQNADGSSVPDSTVITQRLTLTSDDSGTTGTGTFGPYIRALPTNPKNGRNDLRIAARSQVGQNLAGWVYIPNEQAFASDATAATVTSGSGSGSTGTGPSLGGGSPVN